MDKPDLESTGEFLIPEKLPAIDWRDYQRHIFRYLFASEYVKGKIVLDIACGTGYGSYILSKRGAKRVIGGEIKSQPLEYANFYYRGENRNFVRLDCLKLPFKNGYFDLIVSFETIEHLLNPKIFLQECCRVLKTGGVFICSTPNRSARLDKRQIPPFHLYEFQRKEFKDLLQKYFSDTSLFTQDHRNRLIYYCKKLISRTSDIVITNFYRFLLKFSTKERLKSIKKKLGIGKIFKRKAVKNRIDINATEAGRYIYTTDEVIKSLEPKYTVRVFKNNLMSIPYVFIAVNQKPKVR